MPSRILSGILLPRHGCRSTGQAVIHFHPHRVEGDVEPPSPEDIAEVGPDRPFSGMPCKVVALRRMTVKYRDRDSIMGGEGRTYHEEWNVDDWFDASGRTSLTVRWEGGSSSEIHEIGYMIVGEAEEGAGNGGEAGGGPGGAAGGAPAD